MRLQSSCLPSVYDATPSALSARGKRALLIFADARALDLQRRRFSQGFGALFQNPASAANLAPDADHHLFTARSLLTQQEGRVESAPHRPAGERTRQTGDSRPRLGLVTVHPQQGTTFAEKLEAAVETVAALGYAEVVVIGADCPELDAADVATAFEQLSRHALVLGPDQRGGCYLIGLRLEERARLRDVRWQRNTDCRQLTARFGLERTFLLPVKLDLDTLADVRLLARSTGYRAALARAILRALDLGNRLAGFPVHFVLALHRLRARWQLPPPFARAC